MSLRTSVAIVILWWSPLLAQPDTTRSLGFLRVTTVPAGALVFIDGTLIGRSPIDTFATSSGPHVVEVVDPDPGLWTASRTVDTVMVEPGRMNVATLAVSREVVIRTNPWGADVFRGLSKLGTTPMRLKEDELAGVELSLDGYERVVVSSANDVLSAVFLRPLPGTLHERNDVVIDPNGTGIRNEQWALVSAGAMIVTGILSAFYKDKANNAHDSYLRTRSDDDLRAIRRYDRYAGVAIVGTQLSLGAFVALLHGF